MDEVGQADGPLGGVGAVTDLGENLGAQLNFAHPFRVATGTVSQRHTTPMIQTNPQHRSHSLVAPKVVDGQVGRACVRLLLLAYRLVSVGKQAGVAS